VLRAEPVFGEARVVDVTACLHRVQVREVGGDPAAELRVVAGAAVAGDNDVDAGNVREQPQALPVVAERIGGLHVKERDLQVGAHVAGDQDAAVREEDGAVARRVGVVRVDEGARPRPVDLVADERLDAGEQRQVMAGRFLFDGADQARLSPGGHRHRARRRVPGCVAERPRPQQVVPVRVGGPARGRAQAAA
jgi:hypothetical protein